MMPRAWRALDTVERALVRHWWRQGGTFGAALARVLALIAPEYALPDRRERTAR